MSRRTPIKELIEEDSVPGSPRRKSSRIAAKVDDKDVSTPIPASKITRAKRASLSQDIVESQKDDDEISISSNVSSSSSKRVTRAASKSPSRQDVTEGPARRTRRASSTSSLRESATVEEEAAVSIAASQRSRRSTRSMSTSPSADSQEKLKPGTPRKLQSLTTPADTGTTPPVRPRGRRPSISDKVVPLESIAETENKSEETQESLLEDDPIDNDDNLPFKKKRKTLNLQPIEEKSFTEDAENQTEKDVEIPGSTVVKSALPKFSLSLIKDVSNEENVEERDLKALLDSSSKGSEVLVNGIDAPIESVADTNVTDKTSIEGGEDDLDSVFNSSCESAMKPADLPVKSSLNIEKTLDVEDSAIVLEEVVTNNGVNLAKDDEIIHTEDTAPHNAVPQELPKESGLPETDELIPASPTNDHSLTEIRVRRKSGRKSLSDPEDYITKKIVSNDNSKSLDVTATHSDSKTDTPDKSKSLPLNTSTNSTNENGLNTSGASDLSDKENRKELNISTTKDDRRSKSFSTDVIQKSKEMSFCEPMEIEYASDVDKTVCSVTSELANSPKRKSTRLLRKSIPDCSIVNSTPKKVQSLDVDVQRNSNVNKVQLENSPDESVVIVVNGDDNIVEDAVLPNTTLEQHKSNSPVPSACDDNEPKINSNLDTKTCPAETSVEAQVVDDSVLEGSDIDHDEYEENHASIVHSSDEEAAQAERQAYTKTSVPIKTPDQSKHPIFSDETYAALVNIDEDSDKSDDPDFDITTQKELSFSSNSNNKTFDELNAKIDDLIANHPGEASDSEESVTHFLDEFAFEGEEDTPSEGSNDIIEKGESIGSESSHSESEESSEKDSFIDDSEQNDLLSGDEYDLGNDVKKSSKPYSRLVLPSDSEEENLVTGGVLPDDDIEKMSTRPYCGLSPPSVISVRESPSIEEKGNENDEDNLQSVLINTEDNLQSLEKIKQISPAKKSFVANKSSETVHVTTDASTPNNSLTEGPTKPRTRLASFKMSDNITGDDIEQGGIGDRINRVVDAFYSGVLNSSNLSESFSLNVSIEFVDSPSKNNAKAIVEKQSSQSLGIDLPKKRKSVNTPEKIKPPTVISIEIPSSSNAELVKTRSPLTSGEKVGHLQLPSKSKKRSLSKTETVNEQSDAFEIPSPTIVPSKIPILQKEPNKNKIEIIDCVSSLDVIPVTRMKVKEKNKSKNEQVPNQHLQNIEVIDEHIQKKKKKRIIEVTDEQKKEKKKRIQPATEIEISKDVKQLKLKRKKNIPDKQVESDESDMSSDVDKDWHLKWDAKASKGHHEKPLKKKRKICQDDDIKAPAPTKIVRKVKQAELLLKKKKKHTGVVQLENPGWVVEKANITYFPDSILKVLEDTNKSNKVASKPKFVPSSTDDRKSWGYTKAKMVFPSIANPRTSIKYTETFPKKDFKNKMLFNPDRVSREDMKTYLKKKEKTKL